MLWASCDPLELKKPQVKGTPVRRDLGNELEDPVGPKKVGKIPSPEHPWDDLGINREKLDKKTYF